jgi:hypothetical protein
MDGSLIVLQVQVEALGSAEHDGASGEEVASLG